MNIYEIVEAWLIAHNPNDNQIKIAEERVKICDECESKKVILGVPICGECGCPISKKIFTNTKNPCPLKKWGEIDEALFPKRKEVKTML